MSKSNYRRCVGLGVTGRQTNTCFPASIDKILPERRVSPDYYWHYEQTMRRYNKIPDRQKNPTLKNLYGDLESSLGNTDLVFKRARILEDLRDLVRLALKDGMGIVIDIQIEEDAHSLGLETVNRKLGHFALNSTHVPHALRGIVTLPYLFPFISQPNEAFRVRYPFNNANVTIVGR